MRYTTDDNYRSVRNDSGVDIAPKPWYNSAKETHLEVLEEYWKRELWCHDTDGHWGTVLFVFEDGKAFSLEYDAGWDDDGELAQCSYYEEIPLEKTPSWMHKYRDWL